MKVVNQEALKQLLSENMTHVFVYALKIEHTELDGGIPFRIIGDNVGHSIYEPDTSETVDYEAIPFEVSMEAAEEDKLPTMTISVGNVSPDLIKLIKTQTEGPNVSAYIVRIDTTGAAHVELGPDNFSVTSVDWNDASVNFTLGFERKYLQEPAMKWSFSPGIANGLFR